MTEQKTQKKIDQCEQEIIFSYNTFIDTAESVCSKIHNNIVQQQSAVFRKKKSKTKKGRIWSFVLILAGILFIIVFLIVDSWINANNEELSQQISGINDFFALFIFGGITMAICLLPFLGGFMIIAGIIIAHVQNRKTEYILSDIDAECSRFVREAENRKRTLDSIFDGNRKI